MKIIQYKELPDTKNKTGWPWNEETSPGIYDATIAWPKISIVTPSYNQGQFIEETIRSVLLQNYPNLEYIIIDGGSTDNTVEIIKKYEKWITYWVSEKDEGQSHAINKGIEKCSGEIFNWINSDDYLEPKALYTISKKFTNGVYLVTGNSRILEPDGSNWIKKGHNRPTFEEKSYPLSHFFQVATYLSSSALKEIGKLSETLHYVMDVEWHLKYLLYFGTKNIAEIDDIIANYRHHELSKSAHYEDKFVPEINFIFYSLSVQCSLTYEAFFIKNFLLSDGIKSLEYTIWLNNNHINKKLIESTIQNFIFEFITRFYVSGKLNAVKNAYKIVVPENLTILNRTVYNKYYIRIKYLYSFIILWRKIKTILRKI